MLIGRIDSDVAARFASAIVISDRAATARRRKTAGGVKARVLHSVSKRRVHHQRLERGTRHVIFVERPIQQRPFFPVIVEFDPGRLIILNLFEAVRRVAVHRQHFTRLRIGDDDRAVISFQLIDDGLLKILVDCQRVILVEFLFDGLSFDYLPDLGHGAAFGSKQSALEARLAAIRAENMGQRRVHRIFAIDLAAVVFPVVCKWPALAIINPTAQCRFRKTSIAQIFVTQFLKFRIAFRGIARPINVKAENEDRRQRECPTPCSQAAIGRGCAQTLLNVFGQTCRRGGRDRRASEPGAHQRNN